MEKIKNYLAEKTYFPRRFLNNLNFNLFIPIAIILTIVPLIVHVKTIIVDEDTAAVYGTATQTDLFSQEKSSFLLFFSVILLIISILFFKRLFQKKDKVINLILIGSLVFWIFSLCSTVFSMHKGYAIYGAFDRAEGFITITCYMILFLYSIYAFKSTKDYKYFIIPILILVAIEAFLGVFQYTGRDLINSKLGLFLVLGKTTQKLSLMYGTGKLYGTLYHYDFVGSFVAIVLPILLFLTIFVKKLTYKIILGIGTLLSLWLLFGSTSRAGIVGIVVSLAFAIIIFGRTILKKWKVVLIGLISIIILASSLNFATKGAIFNRIPFLIADSFSMFKDTSDFDYTAHTPVKDIKNMDGSVNITFQNETIKLSYENNNFVFKNSKDQIINYTELDNAYTTTDSEFKDISFSYIKAKSTTKVGYIYLCFKRQPIFMFRLGKDYTVHLSNMINKDDIDIVHPETIKLLNGKEKLGSARGYIWSRSIPLLKNDIMFGGGPDTFIYQFPQDDLLGKSYAFDTPNMIVDKPHNLYLQIGINEGLIALAAFLFIAFVYVIDSIKLYALKKDYTNSQVFGIAACLGVIGYLFAGLFNDSVISVAPVFWIVWGTGIAINFINRESLKETQNK